MPCIHFYFKLFVADLNLRSKEGQTAVHYAVRASSIDALRLLIIKYNGKVIISMILVLLLFLF